MIDKDLLKNLNTEQKQALLEQLMSSLSEASVEEKPKKLKQDVTVKGGVNEDFTVTRDINEAKIHFQKATDVDQNFVLAYIDRIFTIFVSFEFGILYFMPVLAATILFSSFVFLKNIVNFTKKQVS